MLQRAIELLRETQTWARTFPAVGWQYDVDAFLNAYDAQEQPAARESDHADKSD